MNLILTLTSLLIVVSLGESFKSGWGPEETVQHSGYITVDKSTDSGTVSINGSPKLFTNSY